MPINPTPINEGSLESKKQIRRNEKEDIIFTLLTPKFSFEDMVLDEVTYNTIQDIMSTLEYSDLIYNKWGLSKVIKEQKSMCANFYGEPGTGKTMAANAIANHLGKKILRVNYADIESKYVGETSKNLVKLFNEAKKVDALLLFDEADALLSRRVTDMSNATDVSVNQTRSVLLTLLETYTGMIIFTTNFISNFDSAFMRRIPYHVRFDLPNGELRVKLWHHYLVPELPADVNIEEISEKYPGISACDIVNATLMASLKAARNNLMRVPQEYFEEALKHIKDSMLANSKNQTVKVEARDVSQEYALSQIKTKEEVSNDCDGINFRSGFFSRS
ncbi:ATP-binding protein [Clostridium estertheticum]|uniref:ATP-binding protein n=1 Tax=Clostridium estertheticum TaxID=238834 RepID=UPI001C0C2F90|nr:ATP-binding protein [Clostridium estertheticum]MBU3178393.1 ATP-binding protein [Clostridium estertheticum]